MLGEEMMIWSGQIKQQQARPKVGSIKPAGPGTWGHHGVSSQLLTGMILMENKFWYAQIRFKIKVSGEDRN